MASSLTQRAVESGAGGVANTDALQDMLELVRQQFRDAEEGSQEERREAAEARGYYDGKQWTETEAKKLRARRQPIITDNKIKDKVEFMLGMERKTRTDPRAFPRNPGSDESQAEAATDAMRYVCDDNRFKYVRSSYSEELFIEGRGAVECCVDPRTNGPQPRIKLAHLHYDRTYVDPHSRELDYCDKRYCGLITWMDKDEALALWPDRAQVIEDSFNESLVNEDTYEDRPYFFYRSGKRNRVQVFQHYFKQNDVWHYCEFVAAGFLMEPAVSVYLDYDTEQPECAYEFQALYREPDTGIAYGLVRRYKDPQDEWNKRRSKALHLLNSKQAIGEKGFAGSGAKAKNEFRTQLHSPDGIVETTPGLEYEIKDGADLSAGHMHMMALAGASLEAAGPNAALAGLSGDISGRAKQLDQEGGLVAIDYPFDAVRNLTGRCYRAIWNRVKQYWTGEMWLRVRDEEQLKFVVLNQPTTRGEVIAAELQSNPMDPAQKAQIIARMAADPTMQEPMVKNPVAEIDVDITIEEVPDVVNLQQEQFQTLAKLAESGVVKLPPAVLIEASQLRNKRKLLSMLSGEDDPMAQRMKELEAKMAELQLMQGTADAAKTMAQADQAKAAAAESRTDEVIKVATFMRGDDAQVPAEKTVRVQ